MEGIQNDQFITKEHPSSRKHNALFPPLFLLLLLSWGCINVFQSIVTEINHDEAYYWMYSRFMDWGYFDHPPMIALFIKTGNLFFTQELGTRFISILSQLLVLVNLWLLIDEKTPSPRKILGFFGIAGSVVMFQMYGFIATPDSPLLLFTSLFLLAYKRFLQNDNSLHVLLLGLSMAGIMYSKYHGGLVILFIVLSNLRIVFNWKFWFAGIFALLLFLPHILWQIHHNLPSLQYHLVSRSRPFNIKHVLNYFPNQLLSFNPFFLIVVLYSLFKFSPRDLFERALYFQAFGFLIFFFISTYRGHVEPHWTIAACIGMIILLYRRTFEHPGIQKYVYRILIPSILIIFFIRAALAIDFLPVNTRFHGQKAWSTQMSAIAGDLPLVFRNSYQSPSSYTFYTGKPATSLNSIYYRKTQYDLWKFEESFFGKPALLLTNANDPLSVRHVFPDGKKQYIHQTNEFFAVQKLKVKYRLPHTSMIVGDTLSLDVTLHNPYPYPIDMNTPYFPVIWNTTFIKSGNDMTVTPVLISPSISQIMPGETLLGTLKFEVPDIYSRKYKFGIVLQAGIIQEAYNSDFEMVTVQERTFQ